MDWELNTQTNTTGERFHSGYDSFSEVKVVYHHKLDFDQNTLRKTPYGMLTFDENIWLLYPICIGTLHTGAAFADVLTAFFRAKDGMT